MHYQNLCLPLAMACSLGTAAAQWTDGELIVRTNLPVSGADALVRVNPDTGNCQVLVTLGYFGGYSGGAAFDNYRGGLLANGSLPPDNPFLYKLWLVQPNGTATAVPGFAGLSLRALCSAGDGRVFYQHHLNANGQIHWIDAADTVHTLMDATGTTPFLFNVEHLLYHAASNALIATTSNWWSSNTCAPTGSTVFRIPLSQDGSRVGSAVTCTSTAPDNGAIMSLEFMPGGKIVMCLAGDGNLGSPGRLLQVDPVTLALTTLASPIYGDLNGGYYSARIDRFVVLDDGANVLRTFGVGGTTGAVLNTSMQVSPGSSGFSPVETMWEVDLNGPGCQGAAIGYGAGLPGAGGFVPTLGVVGYPDIGVSFTLAMDRAVGGAFGMVALGGGPSNLPLVGGSLLVSPVFATMTLFANGVPLTPGAGSAGVPFLINIPALLGATFWFQAGFVDAAAVQGVSLTNGLQLVLG